VSRPATPVKRGARDLVSGSGHDPVRNRKSGRRAHGLVDDAEPLAHLDETLHRRSIGVGVIEIRLVGI
jgi:hypothetical protein